MRCSRCETENADGARFCNQCAAPLGTQCPRCASENAPGANFCSHCAAPLAPAPIHTETKPSIVALTGERRHMTVLFCDLVGSTAIASRLDPEQWRETAAGFHQAAADAITRFDGHVAKYLGDGVMAYFGWPAAHDNDAERGARAASRSSTRSPNSMSGPATRSYPPGWG